LKVKYDESLSDFAFKFNLHRYTTNLDAAADALFVAEVGRRRVSR